MVEQAKSSYHYACSGFNAPQLIEHVLARVPARYESYYYLHATAKALT